MKNCTDCAHNAPVMVPYATLELAEAKHHSRFKWLMVTIIVLMLLLVGSNCAWLWYESQFEEVTTTTQDVVQEADNGENHFVGGDVVG